MLCFQDVLRLNSVLEAQALLVAKKDLIKTRDGIEWISSLSLFEDVPSSKSRKEFAELVAAAYNPVGDDDEEQVRIIREEQYHFGAIKTMYYNGSILSFQDECEDIRTRVEKLILTLHQYKTTCRLDHVDKRELQHSHERIALKEAEVANLKATIERLR